MAFYITISNGLLKGHHRKKMGEAVWEFMWLLDKVTKIDDDGLGWVLGGKPIKLSELSSDMEVHYTTVSRNLNKLAKTDYLLLTHTPYGIKIAIKKAKKSFSKDAKPLSKSISENAKPSLAETLNPISENAKPNKTTAVDNSSMTTNVVTAEPLDINKIFNIFYKINPNISYNKQGERMAAEWLIKKYGLKKTVNAALYAISVQNEKYAPTITTPYQLKEKMAALAKFKTAKKGRKIWKPSHLSPSPQGLSTK